jgi:DNA replication and repair protein RecF
MLAHIDTLTLRGFRNYKQLIAHRCEQGVNVLVGQNGQGKTNLLEAIGLLSQAKSPRTAREQELVCLHAANPHQTDEMAGAFCQATVVREGVFQYQSTLEAKVQNLKLADKRAWRTSFKLNGQSLTSRSQVVGQLPSVSFYSEDLLLFRGTPQHRRSWLDGAISQRDAHHLSMLITYKRLSSQKQQALRQLVGQPTQSQLAVLQVLNEQLAPIMATITQARLTYLIAVLPYLQTVLAQLTHEQEAQPNLKLKLAGGVSKQLHLEDTLTPHCAKPLAVLTKAYITQLEEQLPHECQRQALVLGPQRDDFEITLGEGLLATKHASQGQQRSLVLGLKLAEMTLLKDTLKEWPVLLLDDVMAELDTNRQSQLLHLLPQQAQVFLTTTHLETTVFKTLLAQQAKASRTVTIHTIKAGQLQRHELALH